MNDLTTQESRGFDLSPRNFDEAWRMAEILADSDMVPKDYKGKPGNCLIAMQWGSEVGLKAMQALQNIAVINGRPAMWGDAVIALVRGSSLCELIIETDDGHAATCRVKRRGEPEQSRTFSIDDAKQAGLLGKQGPWSQYPKRMRQMRARAFALRDVFPDVLRGLPVAEEVIDMPTEKHMGPADVVPPAAPPALPACLQQDLDRDLPKIQKIIDIGKKTAADLLATMSTRASFSEQQRAAILSLKVRPAEPAKPAVEAADPETGEFAAAYEAAEEQQ